PERFFAGRRAHAVRAGQHRPGVAGQPGAAGQRHACVDRAAAAGGALEISMIRYSKFFRSLLALAVLGSALALSGCDKAAESASIAPVEIDRSTSCDLDGMLLSD